jgi:hypothetical protein
LRRKRGCLAAWLAIIVGGIILLALILPSWFWWLVCGGALVCGGLWLLRC